MALRKNNVSFHEFIKDYVQVICLEEEAFFALVERVVERLEAGRNAPPDKWVDGNEAKRLLNVQTTTLQSLRDNGSIRFTKPSKKVILYDRDSIIEYLERHARNRF